MYPLRDLCKTLPEVYRPKEKPWIRPAAASVEALKRQIEQCPSGALTYRDNGQKPSRETGDSVRAKVMEGGPLLVSGSIKLEGISQNESLEGTTAFCRCGASANKPFCDGSHKNVNFE